MPILVIQRRMMTLGKVRLGEKGPKGEPRKLETFRFTSASKQLLDAVAKLHGGEVRAWEGAPDDGYYEVTTKTRELSILLPPVFSSTDGTPTTSYSQWFEMWSNGGCQRRCDGATESISGKPCLCNPDERDCKVTTRVSFMLPDIPGLGVWVCESHGWNAAIELPGTLEVLMLAASASRFIPAVLRIEQRTKKVPGEGTRRFVVPVIDLPQTTTAELLAASAAAQVPVAINAPAAPPARPALPSGVEPPAEPEPTRPQPEWGAGVEPEILGDVLAAPEPMVEELIVLAASHDRETVVRAAIKKHRAAHNGYVDADWLTRQREKLLALTRDTEPPSPGPVSAPGGSMFPIPDGAREYQRQESS